MTSRERSFNVAGYSVRTNNADEMSGEGRIGELWGRITQLNLLAAIPHRADKRVIVVYSDYSSDENGEYNYLIGAPVLSTDSLPEDMSYRTVAAGRYEVFTTKPGPLTEVLQREWRNIWSKAPSELGGQRAFITDYEVYDQRSANPEIAQIEIHVGLKDVATSPDDQDRLQVFP